MENSVSPAQKYRFMVAKGTVVLVSVLIVLMLLTNPTEKGFIRFFQEYVRTASGSTLVPKTQLTVWAPQRKNYYLFSTYEVKFGGIDYYYLGMFGSFHHY